MRYLFNVISSRHASLIMPDNNEILGVFKNKLTQIEYSQEDARCLNGLRKALVKWNK